MRIGRKAMLGIAVALLLAATALTTAALGSAFRSADTPPDLSASGGKATAPFKKTKCKMQACAWVNNDGTLLSATKNVLGVTKASTGVYCVQLDKIDATQVQFVLTTVDYFHTGTAQNVTAQWYSPDPGVFWCFGNEITIKTYTDASTSIDAAFVLAIP